MTDAIQKKDELEVPSTRAIAWSLGACLLVFLVTLLCLAGFTFIVKTVGADVGALEEASLISSIPTIFLGIGSFIYASLADFMRIRRLFWVGFVMLVLGSLIGFFFNCNNIWMVILARSLQTFGGEVGGSCYLVLTARYLKGNARVVSYGIFTAGFQLGIGSGVFAGGFLSAVGWQLLFLFPLISIIAAPIVAATMPKGVAGQELVPQEEARKPHPHVDVSGFLIFLVMAASLLLFFSFQSNASSWILLVVFVLMLAAFVLHIKNVKEPFVTPAFFKNIPWVMCTCVLLVLWFPNLSITTTVNTCASVLYNMDAAAASLIMIAPIATAVLVGLISGKVVGIIGRVPAIFVSMAFELIGFAICATCVDLGPTFLSIGLCVYNVGTSLVYSPLVDLTVGTTKAAETGRTLGLVDLTINISSSLGYAVYVPMLVAAGAGNPGILNLIFVCFGASSVLGAIVLLFSRKSAPQNA